MPTIGSNQILQLYKNFFLFTCEKNKANGSRTHDYESSLDNNFLDVGKGILIQNLQEIIDIEIDRRDLEIDTQVSQVDKN